ncbi:hypothetical protein [Albibacterium profundi]|uniref:Bacteriophage CI repressor helix-turn-helix domain-containing protein n=1 Tax=Albibacterium profundi TaxID=3134906 RepID=A0ABV5CEU0_9SPHI
MQSEISQEIVKRFFQALNELIALKRIRGVQTFTRQYGINRRNLSKLQKDHSRDIFQVEWLKHLVDDYGFSAKWLLTGKGKMFAATNQASSTSHA